MRDKEYNRLRYEHTKSTKNGYYAEKLGTECINCGSKENIVYHHIVPLAFGGTNKLSNIAVVCTACHKSIHGCKTHELYPNKKSTGRPREIDDKTWDEVLSEYAMCRIGYRETMKRLKRKIGAHLVDSRYYKEFCKEHGIKKIRNLIDTYSRYNKLEKGICVGRIELESGSIIEMCYEG